MAKEKIYFKIGINKKCLEIGLIMLWLGYCKLTIGNTK